MTSTSSLFSEYQKGQQEAAAAAARRQQIIDEREKIIKSIGGGDIEIDIDDWEQIQTRLSDIEEMANRLSSDEDKKLIAIWKLQIYDSLIHDLSHTKHVREH